MSGKARLSLFCGLLAIVLLCYFLMPVGGSGGALPVLTPSKPLTARPNAPESGAVSAKAAVLIEADSHRVVWQKNSDERLAMASTTKILTAYITLTQQNLDEEFVVDSDAIRVEGSSMGLQEGDRVTLRALAVGMLVASGNDAANAAAVRISGSVSGFVELMNTTARTLGLQNTSFASPSGLDGDGHYSTAFEMAVLASIALQNEDFAAICGATSSKVAYGNPPYLRSLMNHNRLLRTYDGAIGVKTGFTKKAGRCLVSSAEREGVRLICVTLNASDDWNDHEKLLDYGFGSVDRLTAYTADVSYAVPVYGSKNQTVTVVPAAAAQVSCIYSESGEITAKINLPIFTQLPIKSGTPLGNIEYVYNGRVVAAVELIAAADYGVVSENTG